MPDAGLANILAFKRNQTLRRCAEDAGRFQLLQNDPVIFHENFQFIPLSDIQHSPQLDGKNDSSELINLANDACRLHKQPTPFFSNPGTQLRVIYHINIIISPDGSVNCFEKKSNNLLLFHRNDSKFPSYNPVKRCFCMIMSWLWVGILLVSIIFSFFTQAGAELSGAIPQGAQAGFQLALSIGGSLCLWSGVGKLLEKAGVTVLLSRITRPVLGRLFPSTRKNQELANTLSGNVCANLLGLGNAATPMGIRAAQKLADPNRPGLATDELCRLIVLNTASIQLIPGNVAAVRAAAGCDAPFDILPAVWLTSLCSAGLGICAAWLLGKVWRHG